MTLQPRLRIAIVGAGIWGEQHARALSARADVDLVGIMSRDAAKAAARATRYRSRPFVDLDTMLDQAKPDLVCVCLPNREHYALAMELIERRVPLLVEKPLVFDLAEADALVEGARRNGLFAAINFNHRSAKAIKMAHAAITAGRLGDPVFALWRFGGEGGACPLNDNLIETQCHGFDQLEYLCGPIASISAQFRQDPVKGPSTMALALGFHSGGVGAMIGTYDASYAHPGTHFLEICGTRGRLVVHDTVRKFMFHAHGNEVGEVWEGGYFSDQDRSFLLTVDAYYDDLFAAFRRGDPPPVPIQAGRRALRLAHAAIAAARDGRTEHIGKE